MMAGIIITILFLICIEFQSFSWVFGKSQLLIDDELAWYAPFYSGGGYCSEARSYIQALVSVGYTNLTIRQHGDSWNSKFVKGQNKEETALMSQFDKSHRRALIQVCHSEPGAWYTPNPNYHTLKCPDCSSSSRPCYKVGRTMFETDSIPSGWLPRLNFMDEIWVPTNQSRDIFIKAGLSPRKLRVVEETVDTTFYQKQENVLSLITKKKYHLIDRYPALEDLAQGNTFIFLFVGKFEERKGIDSLIRAYYEEFSLPRDSVMFMILTSAYHSSNDFDAKILDIRKKYNLDEAKLQSSAPPYLVLTDIHQDAMPLLYSLANALVIPSFGEGWGRPHMEAMACEMPVLATNWSGPTAFMNDHVAYMIPITGLVESPSWKGHNWAEIDFQALKRLMRHVYSHRQEAQAKGKKAREHILSHFSFHEIGGKLVNEINRIKATMELDKKKDSISDQRQEIL